MAGQICLKWNSFLNNIATSFEHLWEEEGLVDVTLASDGQCLTAHKVILSASSPFFKKVFQTNPCRHPVIILQDIHFTELEALLIFIYKGEVNIEEDKLPALLKAAETLQIRGLTGNDAVPKSSPKEFVKPERSSTESSPSTTNEEQPRRKKQKIHKTLRDSTPEAAPTLRVTRSSSVNEIVNVEKRDDGDESAVDRDPLEMKIEPLDIATEDFDKQDQEVLNTDRLEPENPLGVQGDAREATEEISGLSSFATLADVKPVLYPYQQLPYADLLPDPEVIGSWATSKPMDQLACDIMKLLFTTEERIVCNVNGKMGKKQFDSNKIHLIREVLLHFSGMRPGSIQWEETWKNCVTKIDTSNRGLKRYLCQRRAVYTQ